MCFFLRNSVLQFGITRVVWEWGGAGMVNILVGFFEGRFGCLNFLGKGANFIALWNMLDVCWDYIGGHSGVFLTTHLKLNIKNVFEVVFII